MHREEGALDKFYNANVNLATGLQAVDFVFTRGVEEFRKVLFFLFSFGRGGGVYGFAAYRGSMISGSSVLRMLGPGEREVLLQYSIRVKRS